MKGLKWRPCWWDDPCGGRDPRRPLVGWTQAAEGWGFAVPNLARHPGEDLGTFQFGSTVVMLIGGPRAEDWRSTRAEGPIKVGQRLGAFL